MRTIIKLLFIICAIQIQAQTDLSKLPSGIYFKDSNNYITLDPTLVNSVKKGSSFLAVYGIKQRSIAQIDGKEANYTLENNTKFYFKFQPEIKELNSSSSNSSKSTNAQDNYIDLLLLGANSKAISPNELKLVKLNLINGKRSFRNGIFKDYGMRFEASVDPKAIIDFKYKKIAENTYEVTFPDGLPIGQYCFYYMGAISEEYNYLLSEMKVFDFSID